MESWMPTEEKSRVKLELVEREREKKKNCRVVEEFWLCVVPAEKPEEPEEPGAALRGPI